ncbi:hypothetical protein ABQF61_13080, partial [Xanthomonas campestris]
KPATTQYPSTPGFISNHWYGRWGQVKNSQFSQQFSRRNEKGLAISRKPLMFLAPEVGLEPTTP